MRSKLASQHQSLHNNQKAGKSIRHLMVSLLVVLFLAILGSTPAMASDDTCIDCHGDFSQNHQQFGHSGSSTQTGTVVLFSDTAHDEAGHVGSPPYFGVLVNCITCHDNDLLSIHANNCATCHPNPYEQLGGPWNGTCQQGGCHNTYHDDVLAAHLPFEDTSAPNSQCLLCHNEDTGNNPATDWAVTQQNCLNCHAEYRTDTTPPVTSSDAQVLYEGGAVINFTITDNGRIGIGTTFYRLDGGSTTAGASVTVNAPGPHTLVFWSVDQAGNVEDPPNTVTFEIFSDTTPPTTVANGQGIFYQGTYYQGATINLTATDNSASGVFATYYRINGGETKTGTKVVIPSTPGTFSYTLDYWSVDFGYNIESEKTMTFNVTSGFATLRLVWGDSDQPGFPYPPQPGHQSTYSVRIGSFTGASAGQGSLVYPWNGVHNISVPLRPPTQKYFVRILWNSPYWGEAGQADFPNIYPTAPGQVIRLSY